MDALWTCPNKEETNLDKCFSFPHNTSFGNFPLFGLSPLAFAKSCKGGDVSVLDPALAWDVRCIYLFIGTGKKKFITRSALHFGFSLFFLSGIDLYPTWWLW